MGSDIAARLHEVLAPVVTGSGLYLEHVDVSGPARKRLVRVTVDLPDGPGGVDSDQIGEVSKVVSDALDEVDDALEGAYLLEVSTPGVARPLTEARHFRRAQGRLVTVATAEGNLTGRVVAVEGDVVQLDDESGKGGPKRHEVPLASITKGRIEVELRRAAEGEG
ncbi:ribosome maturation factor RimP [Pseudactinotalea terrae]|uniref:ribosome maturation factor RimP n=1 Tax=Pseudactinotalea terrae TaxID=1743262 RepID=UPI0012E11FC8|nr:ribosome maturation factor RimP [Pseudactinotalea terrae]